VKARRTSWCSCRNDFLLMIERIHTIWFRIKQKLQVWVYERQERAPLTIPNVRLCQYAHVGLHCFIYMKQYPETSTACIFISRCYVVISRVSFDYRTGASGQEGAQHKYPTLARRAYQISLPASLLRPYVCMNVACASL
jgi:hypothetical protein